MRSIQVSKFHWKSNLIKSLLWYFYKKYINKKERERHLLATVSRHRWSP